MEGGREGGRWRDEERLKERRDKGGGIKEGRKGSRGRDGGEKCVKSIIKNKAVTSKNLETGSMNMLRFCFCSSDNTERQEEGERETGRGRRRERGGEVEIE